MVRWFYDETAGFERIEGPRNFFGEDWTFVILDTKKQEEHFIAYQRDLVTCEVGKSNHTLPHPNFSNLRFLGQSLIDYEVVDNWLEITPEGHNGIVIFNRVSDGEIVRFDFHDQRRQRAIEFKFMEFDAGSQDPSLWVVPPAIAQVCNKRTTAQDAHPLLRDWAKY